MQDLDKLIGKIKNELTKWHQFMNDVIGGAAFAFGLACLGTSNKVLYAWLSLIFLFLLVYRRRNLFPRSIQALREKEKTEAEEIILRGLENHSFYSPHVLWDNANLFLGFIFLGAIAAGLLE